MFWRNEEKFCVVISYIECLFLCVLSSWIVINNRCRRRRQYVFDIFISIFRFILFY